MIISTNEGVCRKKQQYSPIIEFFDDGAILLIERSFHATYTEDAIEKQVERIEIQEVSLCIIRVIGN